MTRTNGSLSSSHRIVLLMVLAILGVTATVSGAPPNPELLVGRAGAESMIPASTRWTANASPLLRGTVRVAENDTLWIDAGTRIRMEPGSRLVVSRGAALVAEGTPSRPIVFTCSLADPYQGCWHGIRILGEAPINHGTPTSPDGGCLEALDNGVPYGGCDPLDGSGRLRFVVVQYAIDGLLLAGAGSGSLIDGIQVDRSRAAGVRVDGGSVDLRRLVLTGNDGPGLHWLGGWEGRAQYLAISRDSALNGLAPAPAVLGTSAPGAPELSDPPILFNVTVWTNSGGFAGTGARAVRLEGGARGVLRNLLVLNMPAALDVDGVATCQGLVNGSTQVGPWMVGGSGTLGDPDADPAECLASVPTQAETERLVAGGSVHVTEPSQIAALVRQAGLELPDYRTGPGSAAQNGGAAPPADGWFVQGSTFFGAFPGVGIPWYAGWVIDPSIEAGNTPPTAVITAPGVTGVGFTAQLSGASSHDDDAIVEYAWDFDADGQFDDAFGVTAGFLCTAAGSFPVALRVTDSTSQTGMASTTVQCVLQLAFYSSRDGNWNVFMTNESGSGVVRLTNSAASDWNPRWSPDGTRLALMSERDGNLELYVNYLDGSELRLTNHVASDSDPVWSPTGAALAFVSLRDGNSEIYTIGSLGTGLTRLTNNSADDSEVRYSPDGSRLAFRSSRDGNAEIYVMNADGSNPIRLTNHTATDSDPAWSPDGTRIAFYSLRDGDPEIYIVDADGSDLVRLTDNSAEDFDPQWSPDGTRIAFRTYRDGNAEIYSVEPGGAGLTRLTNDPAPDFDPRWSSDGTRIAFFSFRDGNAEVYSMAANGGMLVRITNSVGDDYGAEWRQ